MSKEEFNAVAKDAFVQAEDGLAVALDPEQADGMGAFSEDALTLQDVLDDLVVQMEGSDDQE